MRRPIDALVTGFTKSPELLSRSLAPLRALKQEGVIRDIHCVTWDNPELDVCVIPLSDMTDVQLTRVSQPSIQGGPNQRGVIYQIENLKAALALVPDDGLILKWRPDFVARQEFLKRKLTSSSDWSSVPSRNWRGIYMPKPVFQSKLWIPWADANSPFFFEDAVFFGERSDIEKLTVGPTPAEMEILGDLMCGSYAHVVRFSKPFIADYPMFANYVRHFRYFRHDRDYRQRSLPYMLESGFFFFLVAAHAWVLHTHFHVDVGEPGDLRFYANAANRNADWSKFDTLKCTSPYDDVPMWRTGTKAGQAVACLSRIFSRLMDDDWQKSLFAVPIPDLPEKSLTQTMTHIAASKDGRLGGLEADFYRGLDSLYCVESSATIAS